VLLSLEAPSLAFGATVLCAGRDDVRHRRIDRSRAAHGISGKGEAPVA